MNIIEINIDEDSDDPLLNNLDIEKLQTATDRILKLLSLSNKEISLYFCDNAKIRELNKTYRNIDKPTDVLSFESGEEIFLGDIAISVERANSQKDEFDSPTLDHELLRLLTHGILHLIGYDHIKSEEETIMRAKEEEIIMEVGQLVLYRNS